MSEYRIDAFENNTRFVFMVDIPGHGKQTYAPVDKETALAWAAILINNTGGPIDLRAEHSHAIHPLPR